jgi:hypothetical protein
MSIDDLYRNNRTRESVYRATWPVHSLTHNHRRSRCLPLTR